MQERLPSLDTMLQEPESPMLSTSKGPRPLTLEIIRDVEGFSKLGEQWNALVRNSGATIYQAFEWTWLWWKHFGSHPSRTLHLVLFYSEGSLAGIAPLFVQETTVAGFVLHRRLQFLGCGSAFSQSDGLFLDDGASDYLDFITDPGHDREICRAFVEYLKRSSSDFDDVQLVNTPEQSRLVKILLAQCVEAELPLEVTRADVCSRMPVPRSFEVYLREQSANVRRRFTQARKAYQSGGAYGIRTVGSPADLEVAFGHLVRLHQNRWNSLGYPGLFADRRFKLFQLEVAHTFMENGWLSFKTANTDGICVAARLAFTFNGCLYDYLSGFDPGLSTTKQRPGLGLLLAMIEESILSDVKQVDFLRGDEKYKFEFNPISDHNWNIQISGATAGQGLRLRLFGVIKKLRMLSYLFMREWVLLGVQWRVHGLPRFFYSYAQFRLTHMTNKLTRRGIPSEHASKSENN